MLTSQLGIRLLLWVGKTVPRPAPPALLQAVSQVEVTNDSEGDDGFRMTFMLSKQRSGEFDVLEDGTLDPDCRVVIGVIMGATPEPLIDGVIYHHQLAPGTDPGTSKLTVMGRDVRVMLDLKEVNAQYKNQADSAIVTQILTKYGQYHLTPTVTPTMDVPIETERVPWQQETDLAFINRLARRNGYIFYVEPLTVGTNMAYWGQRERTGIPQPALTHNLGSASNVDTLYFANDALAPVGMEGRFVEPITKQSLSIPRLPDLRLPRFTVDPSTPRRTQLMRSAGRRTASQAALALLAQETNAPDPVVGTGSLDARRYGAVLRARRLVGLRGAGSAYDGTYYVSKVKHVLTRHSYTQEFSLKREGTGSLLPVVRP
jgi:hypothetical protein